MLSSQILLFHSLDPHRFSFKFAVMSLLQAMDILRATFVRYAGKEGDKDTLTKGELGDLLKHEFSSAGPSNKTEMDKFFGLLDSDSDGVVNFEEYVTFAAALCMICTKK